MRLLGDSEIAAIKETAYPLSSKGETIAILAYGSQVAGYATENSDYDVVMVVKPFSQHVKYFYLKGKVDCSVLLVDPVSFEKDCQRSTLGEFVSGRLLNAYQAIEGESYLFENEVAFKRRVIEEGISEAWAAHGDFASLINFPLSFFLFEKLRKRATIYPPVVYSYSKTYGDDLLLDNLEQSMRGFRRAATDMTKEAIIEFNKETDAVGISLKKARSGLFSKIGVAASFTNKSIRQYAVHGYAGRVRLNVVGKEVVSKIARSRHSGKLPSHIANPKASWSIPYGKLFATSHDWLTDLIDWVGMDKDKCKLSQRSLGEFYTSAAVYTLRSPDKELKLAVKRYHDITGMKWGVLNLWSLKSTNFTVNPIERMFREYYAILQLKILGLNVPEVVSVFLEQKILVTNFIEGKDLSKIEADYLNGHSDDTTAFFKFGEELSKMHNSNYCMGDTKPSNSILSDGKIYLTDLEQAQRYGNTTWDIAEFIYYSIRFTMKEEKVRKMIGAFIEGYISNANDPSVIKKCLSFRYRAPFQPFISPNVLGVIRADLSGRLTSS